MTESEQHKKSFKTLESSFRRMMLTASAVIICIFTIVQGLNEYRMSSRKLHERMNEIHKTVQPMLALALWQSDDNMMKVIGDQLLTNDEVISVSISDQSGKLRYENIKGTEGVLPIPTSFPIHQDHISPNDLGKISLIYTREEVLSNLQRNFFNIFLFNSIKIAALFFLLSWFIKRKIVRPLNQLTKIIQQLPEDPNTIEPGSSVAIALPFSKYENEIGTLARFMDQREQRMQQLIYELQSRETNLQESESHQRELAERMEFIMRANHLGSWEIDLQNHDALFNDRWIEMLGLHPHQVLDTVQFWKSRVHPDDLKQLDQEIDAHIAGFTQSINCMYRLMHEDGHWVWVLGTGTAITRDADNIATKVVGTNLDITDLVNAREEALAANKSKSEFLANMSHEIRTPLNGVLGMTSLLKRTTLDAMQTEFIKTIEISGKQLLGVISDILDLSKVEAGKLDLSPVKTSIQVIVDNMIRIIKPSAETKGLIVSAEVSSNVPEQVYCDDTRLQQVLVNLANNAVKFTSQGEIKIIVDSRVSPKFSDRVEIEFHVVDQGIGIPAEQLKNLFQAFSQADATVTRKYGGTGLGLAISKQIVALMSGSIGVTSVVDQGSDFYFTIQVPTVGAMESLIPAEELKIRAGLKVLIAEDNTANQKVMFKMLRSLGLSPSIASNGVEATHLATNQKFDIIFMDAVMPEMDGMEASRRIIANAKSNQFKVPVIFAMCASSLETMRFKARDVGIHSILEKPVTIQQLHNALKIAEESTSQNLDVVA